MDNFHKSAAVKVLNEMVTESLEMEQELKDESLEPTTTQVVNMVASINSKQIAVMELLIALYMD